MNLLRGNTISYLDDIFSIFKTNSAFVQVYFNDKFIQISFPLLPICKNIDEHMFKSFSEEVDRSSIETKLSGLIQKAKELYIVILNSYKLNCSLAKWNLYFLISIFDYIDMWKELTYMCAYIANFLIILSYSIFPNYTGKTIPVPDGSTRKDQIRLYYPSILTIDSWDRYINTLYAFRILGTIQLFCNSVIMIHHFYKFLIPSFKILKQKSERLKTNSVNNMMILFGWKKLKKEYFSWIDDIYICLKILSSFETLYIIFSVIFTFMAMNYHHFFYVFHLMNLYFRYERFKTMVNSLYVSKSAIFSTLVLYSLILYIIAICNFYLFYNDYVKPFSCQDNMYMCYFVTFMMPFKYNDNYFLKDYLTDYSLSSGRFWYDNIYNIFVTSIYITLFPALIIDTFKYISMLAKQKQYDKQNICFICGNERKDIEKYQAFDHHINATHNYRNYIYYIIYILLKPQDELTTLQKYVLEEIKYKRYNWIPSLL